jgi:demethoxyubiquinone hydroxylase (CLK1/Coq7/Cat5 family)
MTETRNSKAVNLMAMGLAEMARIGGSIVAIIGVLWFFGQAWAVQFVTQTVSEMGFSTVKQIEFLQKSDDEFKSQIKEMKDEENKLGKILEHQGAQIDNIEKLSAEGRSLQSQILLELRRK